MLIKHELMNISRIFIKSMLTVIALIAITSIKGVSQDSAKRRSIDITSTFKPVLKEAVKINFNATPPVVDSTKPKLTYNIPSQFLFLNYQPAELRPVALETDSIISWQNQNYIKAGFGNVHQPYVQTAFSFGDEKTTFFNIFADQFTSKGSLPYQKNSFTDVAIAGTVKTKNKLEWTGRLGFKNDGYYLYGFQPDTLKFISDQLKQRFQVFEGRVALRNAEPTEFGLTYNPNIKASVFSDNHNSKATEENTVIDLPLQKTIGEDFGFNLALTGDLTNYRRSGMKAIQNNIFLVTPALIAKTSIINFQASIIPSWDNQVFHLLPNLLADITTNDKRFTIQLGWIGYYNKGSYQRFASINPWLSQPDELFNTRLVETYAGFKGSLNNHVTYAAKLGLQQYHNMPLFVNDSIDGKTFDVKYASSMQAVQIHGEIGYTVGEDFSAAASLNVNHYTNLKGEEKPWGLLPLEFNTTLRWQILKDLWAKADLWAFDGAQYRDLHGFAFKGDGAFDLNAGVEFRITRQLNLWLQMNNIFNTKYERWNQYQSYGFNILGGVVFSFGQK